MKSPEASSLPAFPIDEVRAVFPYLARCTYLDTASTGLAWPGQADAVAEFYRVDQAEGFNGALRWRERARQCRAALGALLNVSAEAIDFTHSATEAMNLVALAMPLQRGDRIVFAADEFPSVALPWRTRLVDGAELVGVPVRNEADRTDALAAAVERGARVLAVSHVHWSTGTRVDLSRLSECCRRADCWLVVDGSHAVGGIPVDASLADAYCAPTFKRLLSGFGLGFLALSPQLAAVLEPRVLGYANEPPSRSPTYSHMNYPGIYALRATLEWLDALDWRAIHARVATLDATLHRRLVASGFDVVTPPDSLAGVIVIRLAGSERIAAALAARGIHVAEREGLIRVAPHFYNTDDELETFVAALSEESERVSS